MNQIDSVYCINLRRRPDRLSRFLERFPANWYPKIRIFGAVDGANHELSASERFALRNADWPIDRGRGQWGCSFSHEQIWRSIIAKKSEYAMVLEDDATLTGDPALFETLIRSVKESRIPLVFLGPSNHPENTPSRPHSFTNLVKPGICRIQSNLGTMSYLITLSGATDLLKIIDERGHYRAIDQLINDYLKGRDNWYCSSPPLFSVDPGAGSDIQIPH